MHRNFRRRINPAEHLEDARCVIVVGLNYNCPRPAPPHQAHSVGTVANFARYEDYHLFIKHQLRKLVAFLVSQVGHALKFKICVDSTPLAERALAARAGLGFIGRNHMLINPALGPQIFLGELIVNISLKPDQPIPGECSNCDKCIAACPSGALRPDGRFDAARCISYLTIESRDPIPPDLAGCIGNRLFGCDQCVLTCPYAEKAPLCSHNSFKFYPDRAALNLTEILNLSEEQFEKRFDGSPLKRLPLDLLKRNASVCLSNAAT